MSDLETACSYLKKAGIYYLATAEGDQPRVRPFGTAHIFEGRLYIQTGLKKKVAHQLAENPKAEICAMGKDGTWLRISGRLILDERIEAQQALLADYPGLAKMYQAGDGNTAVYYLADAEGEISSFTKDPISLKF
jgi:uncharacterized pyridoxamine 5'-phosphate oxidase family protein